MGSSTSRSVVITSGNQTRTLSTLDGRVYKSPARFVIEKELIVMTTCNKSRHCLCHNTNCYTDDKFTIPIGPDMELIHEAVMAGFKVYLEVDPITNEYLFQSYVVVDDD